MYECCGRDGEAVLSEIVVAGAAETAGRKWSTFCGRVRTDYRSAIVRVLRIITRLRTNSRNKKPGGSFLRAGVEQDFLHHFQHIWWWVSPSCVPVLHGTERDVKPFRKSCLGHAAGGQNVGDGHVGISLLLVDPSVDLVGQIFTEGNEFRVGILLEGIHFPACNILDFFGNIH